MRHVHHILLQSPGVTLQNGSPCDSGFAMIIFLKRFYCIHRCILYTQFDSGLKFLLPYSFEACLQNSSHTLWKGATLQQSTKNLRKTMKKNKKKQTLDKKNKNNMSRLFGGGGRSRQESLDIFFFLFFQSFFVFLCSCVFLPAAPFGLPDSQGSFFPSKECHQRNKTILHFVQGNLHAALSSRNTMVS